jgi:uncharacterized protein (DUF58 family)
MRSWSMFLLLLSMWAGALYLTLEWGGSACRFLLYCLSGILAYAVLVWMGSLNRVEAVRLLDRARLTDGEDVTVTLSVRQRSWMPAAWMVVKEGWRKETEKADGIDPAGRVHQKLLFPWFRKEFTYRYVIRGLERGSYLFDEVEVSAGDLFGFITKRRRLKREQSFVVYPRPLEVRRWPSSANGSGESAGAQAVIPLAAPNIGGIRDYAQGDPLSRIHWKSSAKAQKLRTKIFEPLNLDEMFVYLDGVHVAANRDAFETCVRAAAGLLGYAHRRRLGFGLLADGAKQQLLPYSPRTPHLERGLELLAAVERRMFPGDGPGEGLLQRLSLIPRQAMIVWVACKLDGGRIGVLRSLRGWGRQVLILYVHKEATLTWQERQWKKQLESIGCIFTAVACTPVVAAVHKGGADDVGA